MSKPKTRCAYPGCGEEIETNEPRVRVVWQAATHGSEGSETRATYHEGCYHQIELVLAELRAGGSVEL